MTDIKSVVKKLRKKYGSVGLVSDMETNKFGDYVTTGNKAFDLILDGGVPFGVCTEFVGFSQSGKSLFCQLIAANAQKGYDATVIYIDRESSLTKEWSTKLGLDTNKLIRIPPQDTPLISDAFNLIEDAYLSIREDSNGYIVIVIDSIAAFDKDVDLEKSDSGRKQKSLKDGFRRMLSIIDDKTMVLIVNHYYYKIGVLYGDPRAIAGGTGLAYFNSLRITLEDKRRIRDEKKGNEVIGSWIEIEVIKTRLGPCYRKCLIPFFYKELIPYLGGYIRLLCSRGYMEPNNKTEFKSCKQHSVVYKNEKRFNEFNAGEILKKYPELDFDSYPEFNDK